MSKRSSYQKLKAENVQLKQDIFNIVKNKDSLAGVETILKYSIMIDAEDSLMQGRGTGDGIMKFLGL